VNFTQLRADLTEKISKLDVSDPLRIQALQDIEGLTERMNKELQDASRVESAEVLKVHRQGYLKMIDSVREGAGKVFDAMTKGPGI
jgi:C4-type Zn-finger protein